MNSIRFFIIMAGLLLLLSLFIVPPGTIVADDKIQCISEMLVLESAGELYVIDHKVPGEKTMSVADFLAQQFLSKPVKCPKDGTYRTKLFNTSEVQVECSSHGILDDKKKKEYRKYSISKMSPVQKIANCKLQMRFIEGAIELYCMDHDTIPKTADELIKAEYMKKPGVLCPENGAYSFSVDEKSFLDAKSDNSAEVKIQVKCSTHGILPLEK